jgi:hypothetical protein
VHQFGVIYDLIDAMKEMVAKKKKTISQHKRQSRE